MKQQSKQRSIALVVPYFGKWPHWMEAMLISCKWNSHVDWHFLTDCEEPIDHPENVYFHKSTLEEICKKATKALGFKVHFTRPYKLCDLKPAYGLMFKELLEDYDFWGHCDPDIIWGNIHKFMTPDLLESYDILTTRPHALAGHFCIYRNTEKISSLCLETKKWEEMLNDNATSYMLDESFFSRLVEEKESEGEIKVYWSKKLATTGSDQKPVLLAKQKLKRKGMRFFDEVGKPISWRHLLFKGRNFRWENGKTYNAYGEETMYLHFHQLKKGFIPCQIQYRKPPKRMIIRSTGIHSV